MGINPVMEIVRGLPAPAEESPDQERRNEDVEGHQPTDDLDREVHAAELVLENEPFTYMIRRTFGPTSPLEPGSYRSRGCFACGRYRRATGP